MEGIAVGGATQLIACRRSENYWPGSPASTARDSLRAAGLQRRIALQVPHFTVTPQILQRTEWMVTLPRRVAQAFNRHGQFTVYPLPVKIPEVEVTVHWHESFDNGEGNQWLREQTIETLRE